MKTKTIIWTVAVIAAVVGGYYAYPHLSKKGKKPAEKKSSAAGGGSGMAAKKSALDACPETWNGYKCIDGHWEKNSRGVCYCTGEVTPV